MRRAARQTLTKTLVESTPPLPDKDVWLWDATVRGFGVRITPAGTRSYVYQYRVKDGGPQRRERLGEHPTLTVQKAREMARDRYERVRKGGDPKADDAEAARVKAAAKAARKTVGDVLDEFMQKHVAGLRRHTQEEYRDVFGRFVKPQLGDVEIGALRRSQIHTMLDAHTPNVADRVLKCLRAALAWWQARDDDYMSPIVRGMARTKPRERARKRVLDDDEIRALWAATEDAGVFGSYVRTVLLSAQRPGEVAGYLRRDSINAEGVWLIRASDYKTKVDHAVPLSRAVQEIIAGVPARDGGAVWSTWVQKSGKLKTQLDRRLAELGTPLAPWVLHDLRRTARTLMARAGVGFHIAERVVGHVIAGVAGVYDHHDYLDEKREALERLARVVDTIVHPPAGNVVALRSVGT